MTPRTFWIIFIRILGIWLIADSIEVFYHSITSIFLLTKEDSAILFGSTLLLIIAIIGIYYLIIHFFIFRTDWIIDKLKLDKGFTEEKFELNIHHSTVLNIAIIIIGGILFIDSIPELCRQVYTYLQQSSTLETVLNNWFIYYLVRVFLGYYLMTNSRTVVNLIERQRKKGIDINTKQ